VSVVTDVILLGNLGSLTDKIDGINEWIAEHYDNQTFSNAVGNVDGVVGGHKALQADCYIAAFNYFAEAGPFIDFLRTLPWDEFDNVQVVLKCEHQDTFSLVTVHCDLPRVAP
jgi:hypothetical protein